ncbi:Uncharacterised protein [Klebsiella pneumoniae]|nr:Uncharacterised protein [Klebsiella pneumoniae]
MSKHRKIQFFLCFFMFFFSSSFGIEQLLSSFQHLLFFFICGDFKSSFNAGGCNFLFVVHRISK